MKLSKTLKVIVLVTVMLATWSLVAWAQGTNVLATNAPALGTNAPAGGTGTATLISDPTMLYNALIAFVVPLVVAGIKKITPKIPTLLLPIGATVLGVLSNWLLTVAGAQPHTSLMLGALAGAAGVGVREILDQTKRASAGSAPPPSASTPSIGG